MEQKQLLVKHCWFTRIESSVIISVVHKSSNVLPRNRKLLYQTLPSLQQQQQKEKKNHFYVALDSQTFISVILYCRIGLFYDAD